MLNASRLDCIRRRQARPKPIFHDYSYLPTVSRFEAESAGMGEEGASTPGNESLTGTFSSGFGRLDPDAVSYTHLTLPTIYSV